MMTEVVYSPFAGLVDYVRNLSTPSVIGMISVTGPGMKTMDGVFAESIGERHRLIPFLLEWPVAKDKKVVVRKTDQRGLAARHRHSCARPQGQRGETCPA